MSNNRFIYIFVLFAYLSTCTFVLLLDLKKKYLDHINQYFKLLYGCRSFRPYYGMEKVSKDWTSGMCGQNKQLILCLHLTCLFTKHHKYVYEYVILFCFI